MPQNDTQRRSVGERSLMPVFEHALVVGKFAPLHRGHQVLLDHATAIARRLTVIVWSNPDFPQMTNAVRAGWVSELYPAATVLVGDDGPANSAPDAEQHDYVRRLLRRHGLTPDVVCTNEEYGPAFAASLGVQHVPCAGGRTALGVSGTAVRADVHRHRGALDPRVYRHFVERVVFLGAESTGKTTLAERMADELGTVAVAEYGREHYERRGGRLTLDDYVEIAIEHRRREDEAILRADRYLFSDTNAVTTMFFSHYYDRDSRPALRALAAECGTRYRHHIVCDDDIAFEQDGWRDNEIWRARMQGMVLHDLAVREIPFTIVGGDLASRVTCGAGAARRRDVDRRWPGRAAPGTAVPDVREPGYHRRLRALTPPSPSGGCGRRLVGRLDARGDAGERRQHGDLRRGGSRRAAHRAGGGLDAGRDPVGWAVRRSASLQLRPRRRVLPAHHRAVVLEP